MRALATILQRAWPVGRSAPQLVLGIVADGEGRLYYAGAQDIYPDAETFMRYCKAAGGQVEGMTTLAWCQYRDAAAADPQLYFRRERRSVAVWCQPIQR